MNWQIKPFSHCCHITGDPFEDGQRYVSYLVLRSEGGEWDRFDVGKDVEPQFDPEGEVLCRWSRKYKKQPHREDRNRRQKESAESLFLSLFEEDAESAGLEDEEDVATMKQLLAIFLERKRILKDCGVDDEKKLQVMEHRKSGNVFLIPAESMTPRAVGRIQEKLDALLR